LGQGGQPSQPTQPAQCAHGGDGRRYQCQRCRLRDPKGKNRFDVKRKVEQLEADQVLKSLHRILRQVYAELLEILKDLEGSNYIKDRLARIRKRVVGKSVDGTPGGVPSHPEILQDVRDEVVQRVVNQGRVCNRAISDTEVLQKLHELRRQIERVGRLR
jgi:hypothetical protein